MRRQPQQVILQLAAFLLFTGVALAAEKSVDSIRQAWRRSLNGVQVFGIALEELDADAKACGLDGHRW
jgi:hypothetical protein